MNKDQHSPFQREFLDYCSWAFRNGASDIHLEPKEDNLLVRIRIDGMMRILKTVEQKRVQPFLRGARSMCQFDPNIIGQPQDQRFAHPWEQVDFRANIMPVADGEKIVLRLLERNKEFDLDRQGPGAFASSHLKKALDKGQGLIVVSGPTGSGKSTLLYAAMSHLDSVGRNISTIEDPVEYKVRAYNQTEVDRKKDYGFAEALRALMRQDPDVIMVGEIRDEETAEIAVHAADTGHLVLTTVHANRAEGILRKLGHLGIPEDNTVALSSFLSWQRLVPKLCTNCRVKDESAEESVQEWFPNSLFTPYVARGCEQCEKTPGYKGRQLVFEYMVPDKDDLGKRELVYSQKLEDEVYEHLKMEISMFERLQTFLVSLVMVAVIPACTAKVEKDHALVKSQADEIMQVVIAGGPHQSDHLPFDWAVYEDPSRPEFWDDGGDGLMPRPFLELAKATLVSEEAARDAAQRIQRWQDLQWETIRQMIVSFGAGEELKKYDELVGGDSLKLVRSMIDTETLMVGENKADHGGSEINWNDVGVAYIYRSGCPACKRPETKNLVETLRRLLGERFIVLQTDYESEKPLYDISEPYDQEWRDLFPHEVTPTFYVQLRGSEVTRHDGLMTFVGLSTFLKKLIGERENDSEET